MVGAQEVICDMTEGFIVHRRQPVTFGRQVPGKRHHALQPGLLRVPSWAGPAFEHTRFQKCRRFRQANRDLPVQVGEEEGRTAYAPNELGIRRSFRSRLLHGYTRFAAGSRPRLCPARGLQ